MLINQARNLDQPAVLVAAAARRRPSSARSSCSARRRAIAYNVENIQSQFKQPLPDRLHRLDLVRRSSSPKPRARWQNTLSGFQDALKTQATAVGNLTTAQTQASALVVVEPGRYAGALASHPSRQPVARPGVATTCRRHRPSRRARARRKASRAPRWPCRARTRAQEQLQRFLVLGCRLPAGHRHDVPQLIPMRPNDIVALAARRRHRLRRAGARGQRQSKVSRKGGGAAAPASVIGSASGSARG